MSTLLFCYMFFGGIFATIGLYATLQEINNKIKQHTEQKQKKDFERWQQDRIINRILHADF